MNDISNTADLIDSRDIVARIEELQGECADEGDEICKASSEDRAELALLEKLVEQINDYSGDDAEDGVTLIRDSYFEDYAKDLADDIGAIDNDAKWPNNCIDWERAARELQHDYTIIDYDGVDYWVR